MTYNLFEKEALKLSCDESLCRRLFEINKFACLSWTAERLVSSKDVIGSVMAFGALSGLSDRQARHLYYGRKTNPLSEVKKREDFKEVMAVVCETYPCETFLLAFAPHGFRATKQLAVELLFEKGCAPTNVSERLSIAESHSYALRKEYIRKELFKQTKNGEENLQ